MQTKETEVLIVGGGPIGNYLAYILSPELDVLVVEKTEIGKPVRCAGHLETKTFEEFPFSKSSVLNEIRGAAFEYRPFEEGINFRIQRDSAQTFVIDREAFDKDIAKKAKKRGANYLLETEYLADRGGRAILESEGKKTKVEYNYLVGADGVHSRVSDEIGSELQGEVLVGPQLEVPYGGPENLVEVIVDRRITDFFVWIIPTSKGTARVGTLNGKLKGLIEIVDKLPCLEKKILKRGGGAVPVGTKDLYRGKKFLVGDAAAQVKPLTGGGIYYGLKGASYLAEAISKNDPKLYPRKWEKWKEEIKTSMRYRKVYKNIPEIILKLVFKSFTRPEVIEEIEREAEYSKHSSILKKIIPKVLGLS